MNGTLVKNKPVNAFQRSQKKLVKSGEVKKTILLLQDYKNGTYLRWSLELADLLFPHSIFEFVPSKIWVRLLILLFGCFQWKRKWEILWHLHLSHLMIQNDLFGQFLNVFVVALDVRPAKKSYIKQIKTRSRIYFYQTIWVLIEKLWMDILNFSKSNFTSHFQELADILKLKIVSSPERAVTIPGVCCFYDMTN